ncbi:hypothetical protein DYBT9275_00947 [Dyadobacter sp. CECT 9275]|uniref:Fucolectin tachylectin-4 pentraxin-1 domain-containing protein n=1 Tax=Dyadobacter helix TaxID=2822344 RepID=A0A916J9B0_9BACT|nr:PVC-type heme-binding CxxCH protein [Dyadobacter sp. CECT 9275]CAG4992363.1 hypothetical protein DYBT9275_00947 [Dyadobacter sp. CECT 9275]
MKRSFRLWLLLALTTMAWGFRADDLPLSPHVPSKLDIKKGARIALIGNTLADRMQEDGWLETYIQYRFPDKDISFRNLGFSADEVVLRYREEAFGTPDEWLTHVGADVIFAFFGFNESFSGESGLPRFKKDLTDFIKHSKQQKYNGQSAPELVLFSPIANENLKSRFLPDGKENNKRIEMYTKAMAEVAALEGVMFVDLYKVTKKLYVDNEGKDPFTINGIHFNSKGNKAIGDAIDTELFGPAPDRNKQKIAALNTAVKDKDFHWFNRYRTTDGYNVYGGRSWLSWGGKSNRDVMLREMEMFDVMTANRDKIIWQLNKTKPKLAEDGRELAYPRLKPDDSNLPEPLHVDSYESGVRTPRTAPYKYLGGEEAIGKMTIPADLKINLFASEEQFPDLINPMQMAFDADERLWVVTWPTYPHWNPRGELNDKLLIFPDDDGDGKADRSIVFADSLNSITGFTFWNGGVVVAAPPLLYYMKDTNGDDVADYKVRLLDGLSSADSHHSANSFQLGADGALYYSRGIFNKKALETPYGPFRSAADGIYRFDPLTFEFSFHFPVGPNPHGDVFDQWGYQFVTDATGGTGYYVNIGKGFGARQLYEQKVRPVPGIGILSSEHFPSKYNSQLLIANVIGFQGIKMHNFKYQGADIKAVETGDLVSSTDPNFRPSGMGVGGDGALYILDWQNALIGHMQHNMRDPGRDHTHGRIYRLTAKDRPLLKPAKMKGATVGAILQNLRSKQNGTREIARAELTGRPTNEVLTAVDKFCAVLDPKKPADYQPLLECLWIYEMHRVPNKALLAKVFSISDARTRSAAVRTLGHWGPKVENGIDILKKAIADPEPLVRAQAIQAATAFKSLAGAEIMMASEGYPLDIQMDEQISAARKSLDQYWRLALKEGVQLSRSGTAFVLKHGTPTEIALIKQNEQISRSLLSQKQVPFGIATDAVENIRKLTGKDKATILLELISKKQELAPAVYQMLAQLPKDEVIKNKAMLTALLLNEGQPAQARTGAASALLRAGVPSGDLFAKTTSSAKGKAALLNAIQLLPEGTERDIHYPQVKSLLTRQSAVLNTKVPVSNMMGRYVYIILPYNNATLSLAEVEVISGGKNVAIGAKARQSGVAGGRSADHAIDGIKGDNPDNYTQTETFWNQWWEVDLGKSYNISQINIWNREDCCMEGLDNFTIKILNENYEVILKKEGNKQPEPYTGLLVSEMASQQSLAQLAMSTMLTMPSHQSDALNDLARLLNEGKMAGAVMNTMGGLDLEGLSGDKIRNLADNILRNLESVPPFDRDQDTFKNGTELMFKLSMRLPASEKTMINNRLRNIQMVEISINSIAEQMRFDINEFKVLAGQPVKITFRNPDAMPHNVVVLNPGKAKEIGELAGTMADGFAKNYVPESKDVLAATKLVKGGQTDVVKFMAPSKPGDYEYICSFPGHWSMMKGTMKVRPVGDGDFEKYRVTYKGDAGPGLGKKIVFIASDHEYRGEETLPALARILAKRYGFTCTVVYALDQNGHIEPGGNDLRGLDVLDDADLMFIFTRFSDLPDEEMRHIDNYLKRGGPVIGLRTATHAFNNIGNANWEHYSYDYNGPKKAWKHGFGEFILGETWVSHYGNNHSQSSRLLIEDDRREHPVLRGVKDMWVQSGGYTAYPEGMVLARGQVLNGMTPTSEADKTKELLPVAWVRSYILESGSTGRVFATTHGASEDILNDGFRRMLINAVFWSMEMEKDIRPDNDISFVGPYKPTTFNFNGNKENVKPADLAGWDSLIMPGQFRTK